jgi:hypothetical protein
VEACGKCGSLGKVALNSVFTIVKNMAFKEGIPIDSFELIPYANILSEPPSKIICVLAFPTGISALS